MSDERKRCDRVRRWLDRSEASGPLPDDLERHAAGCGDCRGLRAAYVGTVGALRDATSLGGPDVPDARILEAAMRERAARRRWFAWRVPAWPRPAWSWGLVPVAGAMALAVVLWPGTPAEPVAPPAPEAAVVVAVPGPVLSGSAGIVSAGADPRTVAAGGTRLAAGDVVQTGSLAAVITDPTAATLALAPGTRVRVARWSGDAVEVRLEEGSLDASVRHRDPGQSFEVRTEYAVARVVGTRFSVVHHAGGTTDVTVNEGIVAVESSFGAAVARLPAGGSVSVGPTGPVAAPAAVAAVPEPAVPAAPAQVVCTTRIPPRAEPVRRAPDPATAVAATAPVDPAAAGSRPAPAVAGPEAVARAREMLAAGHDREAVALLVQALEGVPANRPRVLAVLGDAHRLGGRLEDARTAYEAALAQWPGTPPEGLFVDLAGLLDDRMHRRGDAAGVWMRYLTAWPHGQFAARAVRVVADAEEAAGRTATARALQERLVDEFPADPEAAAVLVRAGRAAIARGDLDGAAAWFGARVSSPAPDLAEAALVGLMRVRLQQGRTGDVHALAAEHARRFPAGPRRSEVTRLEELARDGRTGGGP